MSLGDTARICKATHIAFSLDVRSLLAISRVAFMNVSFPCHVCPTRTPTVLQPKGACLARAQGAPRTWLESSPRLCHACQNPGFATPKIGVRTPGFVAAAVLCHVRKLCKVLLQSQVRAPEVELQRHDPGRHENELWRLLAPLARVHLRRTHE